MRRECSYSKAASLIRSYQADNPESADPHVESGHIEFDRENYELANAYFDQALQHDFLDERALAWKIALVDVNGDPSTARRLATDALSKVPDSPAILVALGRVEQRQDKKKEALKYYEKAISVSPNHLDAVEWRIEVIGRIDGYKAALQEAEAALPRFPHALELLVAAYVSSIEGKEEDEAQHILDRALEIHPECIPPLQMKIDWLLDKYRAAEALTLTDRGLALAANSSDLQIQRGRALLRQDNFEKAIESFAKATQIAPMKSDGPEWLGLALQIVGRPSDAKKVVTDALTRMPDSVNLQVTLAAATRDCGDLTGALQISRKATEKAPRNSVAVLEHIESLISLHQYKEAETVALELLQKSPNRVRVIERLGHLYSLLNRDEEALEMFERANSTSPRPERVAAIARTLRILGRLSDAETLLNSKITDESNSTALLVARAQLLEYLGRYEEAASDYEKAVGASPHNHNIRVAQINVLLEMQQKDLAEIAAIAAANDFPGVGHIQASRATPAIRAGLLDDAEAILIEALETCEYTRPILLTLIEVLTKKGDLDAALLRIDQLIGMDETDTSYQMLKVANLIASQEYEAAIAYTLDLVKKNPLNIEFRTQLGWLRSRTRDYEAAYSDFRAVFELRPTIWAARCQAKALCELRKFSEAEALVREEIRKKPHYTVLRYELAIIHSRQGDYKAALTECERSKDIKFGSIWGNITHASILRRLNRLDEAESILLKSLDRNPSSVSLRTEIGKVYDDRNEYEEALHWFDQALAIDGSNIETLVSKSATLRSLGRFREAEATLEPALLIKPNSWALLIESGWVLRDQGYYSRASKVFNKVSSNTFSPTTRADALRCQAWVLFSSGEFEQAQELFTEVLDEDPFFIEAKIGLAWTLVRLDSPETDSQAEKLCIEVLDLDSRNHLAHTCLGVLYARQHDFQLAEHHLRRSLELDPFDGSFVDLAALLIDLERLDDAEELLKQALERNWYDVQAHIELGRLYIQREIDGEDEASGSARLAATHFRQALALDPQNPAAATGLAVNLSRSFGELVEAERVIRRVIEASKKSRDRWQLLLTLARLLIGRGEATQRTELYLEAIALSQEAIELASHQSEPYFVAGIAAFKAGSQTNDVRLISLYRRKAVRYLKTCLTKDREHTEARRALALAEESLTIAKGSLYGSRALTWITALLLVGLWVGFFTTNKLDGVILGTMTAVLAGLFALSFILPLLVRVKLPGGVEADLSASLSQVSAGPTGDLSIGRGRFSGTNSHADAATSSLNVGPRGELPRLGAGAEARLK
ncbi:tetratricopeptide repeat protein [Amycolatopsis japonica]|uniref:tetratricopeptide repeat protein n=1 Tax=Amycolatopsis japonica TaxID=208439 RepID=UPI00332D01E2